jgi:surface protein
MKKLLFLLPLLAIISCDKTDTENSGDAQFNSRGCLECDNYTAGQSFLLDGIRYEVADKAMLLTAIVGGDDLTKYCTSKIMDMSALFSGAYDFNQNISTWDVSNVTNMAAMFRAAFNFNQDIGNWDVSSVTNMDLMFSESDNFNQDLTQWCVSQFPAMPYLFGRNSVLTTSNHPVWGTCP